MIKSMTAFSRMDKTTAEAVLTWEIRSVNHRYLDISLHLPEGLSSHENSLKEIIRNKLGRGKLDASLTYKLRSAQSSNEIHINKAKVSSLLAARHKVESFSENPISLSFMDILQWPGIVDETQNNHSYSIELIQLLLDASLDDLIKMRELEGGRLLTMILSRGDAVIELVKSVRLRRVEVQTALREKIMKKIADIDVTADTNRLEQELVYQAQRLDVDEELDRLDSHIEEVKAVLARDEPVGRRLDFLMQELNREANTLASKSNDTETTRVAVELKVLIEQIREQCLNIE